MAEQETSPPQYTPSQQQQQHQTAAQGLSLRVFRLQLDSVAHDPLDPVKRYHDGIFVETNRSLGTGTMYQVTGDVISQNGMRYEEKADYLPSSEARLHHSTPIGVISTADYDGGVVTAILSALPTPSKQQGISFWEADPQTGRHELIWTKENGEPYGPAETRRPTFKCNEWTSLHAIPALRDAGILRDTA